MNKYSDKSDFEINLRVAQIIFTGAEYDVIKQSMGVVKYQNGSGKGLCHVFDPCNNLADAMPIIIENGISLIFDTGCKAWVAGIAYWVDGCEWQVSYEVERMNQYRAAMEVFLMMKEAENAGKQS